MTEITNNPGQSEKPVVQAVKLPEAIIAVPPLPEPAPLQGVPARLPKAIEVGCTAMP